MDLTTEEPTRSISTKTDTDQANREQEGYNIKYQEALRIFMEREDKLEKGLKQAYAYIFASYCTKTMQQRIEEHPNFNNMQDDPIELLKTIKLLMHDPVRAQYPLASLTDALTWLINVKQGINESLIDYVKRFKQLRDVLKSYLGIGLLDYYVEQTDAYRNETDNNKQKEMKEDTFEQWLSYLVVTGSDHSKYGTLINGLKSQFSLGTNQYPKTITAATDALSDHRFD